MITYSGVNFSDSMSEKFPTIEDVAIMQGRMCRYNGACKIFWPVLIHSICVAELIDPKYKIYGILHDAAEIIISDIPTPTKDHIEGIQEIERDILNTMLTKGFGIPIPTDEEWDATMVADHRILLSECRLFGPDNIGKFIDIGERDSESDDIVNYYFKDYVHTKYDNYTGIFNPTGKYIQDFIHRFISYRNDRLGINSYVTGGDCFATRDRT